VTIGDYDFTVSAEIPNIQSRQDLDIVFRLAMQLPAAPEDVSKTFQDVTGVTSSIIVSCFLFICRCLLTKLSSFCSR
jgi:hypothetical protein